MRRAEAPTAVDEQFEPGTHPSMLDLDVIDKEARTRIAPASGMAVVALVTTRDRPNLLDSRALPSIAAQSSAPDAVVLVDDSDPQVRAANAEVLALHRIDLPGTEHLANARTRGAGGAWNTGIAWCLETFGTCWVALLDDDDTWEPDHVALCRSLVAEGVDAVISVIRLRVDGRDHPWQSPVRLEWRDFLRGNPGWQGSNTFVRSSRLAEAGGFDEGLDSTHDRDLAIRLLRLPGFVAVSTGQCTVNYHLETSREQLSTRGAERKRKGLARFWSKYRSLMTEDDAAHFLARAKTHFGFEPEDLEC